MMSMMAFSKLTCSIGSLAINIGLTPSASPGSHMEAGGKVEFSQEDWTKLLWNFGRIFSKVKYVEI